MRIYGNKIKELKNLSRVFGGFGLLFGSSFALLNSASIAHTLYFENRNVDEDIFTSSLRLSRAEIAETAKEFDVSEEFVQNKMDELIEEVESSATTAGLVRTGERSDFFNRPTFLQQGFSTFRWFPPVMQAAAKLGELKDKIRSKKESIQTLENKIWGASGILFSIKTLLFFFPVPMFLNR